MEIKLLPLLWFRVALWSLLQLGRCVRCSGAPGCSEGCVVWLCGCQHTEMGNSWIHTDWAINNGHSMQESFYQGWEAQNIPFILPFGCELWWCPQSPVNPGQPVRSLGSRVPCISSESVCAQHCPPAWMLLRSAWRCHLQVPGLLFSRRDSSSFFIFLSSVQQAQLWKLQKN